MLLLLIGAAIGFGLFNNKTVTITISGDPPAEIITRALTVQSFLKQESIPLYAEDKISPALTSRLRNDTEVQIIRGTHYTILAGEEVYSIISSESHPALILEQARVVFDNQTQHIYLDQEFWSFDKIIPYNATHQLEIRDLYLITFETDEGDIQIQTDRKTVGEALWQTDIRLSLKDNITPNLETPIQGDMSVQIDKAIPLQIVLNDKEITAFISHDTNIVGEALLEAGMPLQGLDYSEPGEYEPVPQDGIIHIIRVEEKLIYEQTPLPFEDITQILEDVALDSAPQVVQGGEYGISAKRIRVRYEDGKEVERIPETEWMAKEPQSQIVGYGSKVTVQTLDTGSGTIEYYRAMTFYATSYSPSRSGTDPSESNYGYVACGEVFQAGFVGVDLDYIPCGTRLYIPGYGIGIAMDTGGNISGAFIDLGYLDDEYQQWNQNVTVYFLTPVPDYVPLYIHPGTW